jgi:uncharacterized integral membrane protein
VQGSKRIALGVLMLLLVLTGIVFVLENHESVPLAFLGWSTVPLPVSIYVILALLLGMIVGPMLRLIVGRSAKRGL